LGDSFTHEQGEKIRSIGTVTLPLDGNKYSAPYFDSCFRAQHIEVSNFTVAVPLSANPVASFTLEIVISMAHTRITYPRMYRLEYSMPAVRFHSVLLAGQMVDLMRVDSKVDEPFGPF
jgi:hypothetical protein